MKNIGKLLIAIGIGLLAIFMIPIAYDLIFKTFQEMVAGGDYWLSVVYMILISAVLIGIGTLIVRSD